MDDLATPGEALARLRALKEAGARQRREVKEAGYRQRIIDAAGIDPDKLSEQGRGILDWLTRWDEWTTSGLVEILAATRTVAQVADHRADVDRKLAAFRGSGTRIDTALARCDARWDLGQ